MSVDRIQEIVRANTVVKSYGPKVTLSFNDDQLCVTVLNRVKEADVPVTFSRVRLFCLVRRWVRWLLVRTRRGLQLGRFVFSRPLRCVPFRRSVFSGKLNPTVTQEGPVRVCNTTKVANSSILLSTPTSQIAQSMSTTQRVSSAGTSIFATPVLASQSSSLRISPAFIAPTSANVIPPVATMS